jgi:hypothetical protein
MVALEIGLMVDLNMRFDATTTAHRDADGLQIAVVSVAAKFAEISSIVDLFGKVIPSEYFSYLAMALAVRALDKFFHNDSFGDVLATENIAVLVLATENIAGKGSPYGRRRHTSGNRNCRINKLMYHIGIVKNLRGIGEIGQGRGGTKVGIFLGVERSRAATPLTLSN